MSAMDDDFEELAEIPAADTSSEALLTATDDDFENDDDEYVDAVEEPFNYEDEEDEIIVTGKLLCTYLCFKRHRALCRTLNAFQRAQLEVLHWGVNQAAQEQASAVLL